MSYLSLSLSLSQNDTQIKVAAPELVKVRRCINNINASARSTWKIVNYFYVDEDSPHFPCDINIIEYLSFKLPYL